MTTEKLKTVYLVVDNRHAPGQVYAGYVFVDRVMADMAAAYERDQRGAPPDAITVKEMRVVYPVSLED